MRKLLASAALLATCLCMVGCESGDSSGDSPAAGITYKHVTGDAGITFLAGTDAEFIALFGNSMAVYVNPGAAPIFVQLDGEGFPERVVMNDGSRVDVTRLDSDNARLRLYDSSGVLVSLHVVSTSSLQFSAALYVKSLGDPLSAPSRLRTIADSLIWIACAASRESSLLTPGGAAALQLACDSSVITAVSLSTDGDVSGAGTIAVGPPAGAPSASTVYSPTASSADKGRAAIALCSGVPGTWAAQGQTSSDGGQAHGDSSGSGSSGSDGGGSDPGGDDEEHSVVGLWKVGMAGYTTYINVTASGRYHLYRSDAGLGYEKGTYSRSGDTLKIVVTDETDGAKGLGDGVGSKGTATIVSLTATSMRLSSGGIAMTLQRVE